MAISVIQSASSTSFSSGAATISCTATTGSMIVIGVGTDGSGSGSRTVSSITDNKSNTYTQVPGVYATDSNNPGMTDLWYCAAPVAGVTSIVVTLSSNPNDGMAAMMELGNTAAASVIDTSGHITNGGGANPFTTSALSTTVPGDILIYVCTTYGTYTSVASPYTTAQTGLREGMGYHIPTGTVSSESASVTQNQSGQSFCSSSVAIKPNAGGDAIWFGMNY